MNAVQISDYGFPVIDRAEQARIIAAAARERLAAAPCTCVECVRLANMPGVLRILAAAKDRSAS